MCLVLLWSIPQKCQFLLLNLQGKDVHTDLIELHVSMISLPYELFDSFQSAGPRPRPVCIGGSLSSMSGWRATTVGSGGPWRSRPVLF